MQFYVPRDGQVATRLDIPNVPSPSSIDMLRHPQSGQPALEEIYNQTGVSKKQERFQIIIQCYSTDQSLPLDQCLSEWYIIHARKTSQSENFKPRCCCSQDIERLYFVQNSLNGNILLVGGECIKKFGSDSLKTERQIISKFYRKCEHCDKLTFFTQIVGGCCPNCSKHAENEKRYCRSCLRLSKIRNNNWRCNACIEHQKPIIEVFHYQKTCQQCRKIVYLYDDVDTCKDCHRNLKRSAEKVYLNVPYNQKDQAKNLFGAHWEPAKRKWWVPQNANFANMPPKWLLS